MLPPEVFVFVIVVGREQVESPCFDCQQVLECGRIPVMDTFHGFPVGR